MDISKVSVFREQLRILERHLQGHLAQDIKGCGVSMVQCHSLLELNKEGVTSLKDLAGQLELDKSTVSRTVDQLVGEGWVNRETNHMNRRFISLTLTQKGQAKVDSINQFCDRYYQKLFDIVPVQSHGQLLDSIKLLAGALSQLKRQDLL